MSALFSGLNLGLMSLSPHDLKRRIKLGDKRAKKIYSVRKNGNLLLVTLLLGNVAVTTSLSVFLDSITFGVIAIIASTALITVFGEIIPQAVLSRYALEIVPHTVWIVRIFMFILYPICKPIAWALDKVLGEEMPTIYSRKELVEILEEHSSYKESDLRADEEKIARGALSFGNKIVKEVMTPRSVVLNLDADWKLNDGLLSKIKNDGHSRYPVYKNNVDTMVGILYVKDLIIYDGGRTVGEMAREPVNFIHEEQNLDEALRAFLKTKHHLFVVVNSFKETVGVVSMEDVMEEILQDEIVDEFDKYDDLRLVAKHRRR
jgi:metal transporter CNNM